MAKQSMMVKMAQQMCKEMIGKQTMIRLAVGFDAALIAAHEVLHLGPGRAAAFANAYHDALDDLSNLYLSEPGDPGMDYGKGKRDEIIRKIVGEENFVSYDNFYGATYLDELKRIRVLEEERMGSKT